LVLSIFLLRFPQRQKGSLRSKKLEQEELRLFVSSWHLLLKEKNQSHHLKGVASGSRDPVSLVQI
jgi:hypothetical protein